MFRSISKQSEGIHVVSSEEEKEDGKDLQERKVFTARCYASAVLRSTQPCIPLGSLNRVPASAGVRAGMSPLPGGR